MCLLSTCGANYIIIARVVVVSGTGRPTCAWLLVSYNRPPDALTLVQLCCYTHVRLAAVKPSRHPSMAMTMGIVVGKDSAV